MKDLFKDITIGLTTQGWKILGGNDDNFLILYREGATIKVFADNYKDPRHFIVRYSYNEKEEKNSVLPTPNPSDGKIYDEGNFHWLLRDISYWFRKNRKKHDK
jgi:hypothetical protein